MAPEENQMDRIYRILKSMNNRAASGIATPKNYATSPAFFICYKRRKRGKHLGQPSPAQEREGIWKILYTGEVKNPPNRLAAIIPRPHPEG
jgi:hypothetical protein